jgi:hypothetical protein
MLVLNGDIHHRQGRRVRPSARNVADDQRRQIMSQAHPRLPCERTVTSVRGLAIKKFSEENKLENGLGPTSRATKGGPCRQCPKRYTVHRDHWTLCYVGPASKMSDLTLYNPWPNATNRPGRSKTRTFLGKLEEVKKPIIGIRKVERGSHSTATATPKPHLLTLSNYVRR